MILRQQMEGRATSSGLDSPVRTKVAIITGASRGIGHGIAERLFETGHCLVANSRNITRANTLQPGERLKLIDGDIGTHNVAKQLVDSAILNFGGIDLLVNNAGVFIPKPFTEYTAEDFRTATVTNLGGFLYVWKARRIKSDDSYESGLLELRASTTSDTLTVEIGGEQTCQELQKQLAAA